MLRALSVQRVWPLRTTTGWRAEVAGETWVPATKRILAGLSRQGLVADESIRSVGPAGVVLAARFVITDLGQEHCLNSTN